MELSRRSLIARFYLNLLPDEARRAAERSGVSLCSIVATIALACLMCVIALGGLVALGVQAVKYWREWIPAAGFFVGLGLLCWLVVVIVKACARGGRAITEISPTAAVVAAWVRAKQSRVCPQVRFTDDESVHRVPR